jgi:hypothetical protein
MDSKATLYEELELISPKPSCPSLKLRVSQGCRQLLQALIKFLTSTDEIKIYQVERADGSPCFNAYDPINRIGIRSASEDELRVWIEQRRTYQAQSCPDSSR